jgi:hypothetical protein
MVVIKGKEGENCSHILIDKASKHGLISSCLSAQAGPTSSGAFSTKRGTKISASSGRALFFGPNFSSLSVSTRVCVRMLVRRYGVLSLGVSLSGHSMECMKDGRGILHSALDDRSSLEEWTWVEFCFG